MSYVKLKSRNVRILPYRSYLPTNLLLDIHIVVKTETNERKKAAAMHVFDECGL